MIREKEQKIYVCTRIQKRNLRAHVSTRPTPPPQPEVFQFGGEEGGGGEGEGCQEAFLFIYMVNLVCISLIRVFLYSLMDV